MASQQEFSDAGIALVGSDGVDTTHITDLKDASITHIEFIPLTPPRTPTLSKAIPPLQPSLIPKETVEETVEEIAEDTVETPAVPAPSTLPTPPSKATQTRPFTDSDLAPAIQSARTEHLCRLADLYTQLTNLASTHDTTLSSLYANKITTLESRLAASLQTQLDLTAQIAAFTTHTTTLTAQHQADLAALRQQLAQAHEEHAREAHARAEATHALLARKDEEFARGIEAVRIEMARHAEEQVRLVREEMAGKVKQAREEMADKGDQRIAAIKEEMVRQRTEMGRMLDSEREARKRAEMSRRGGDAGAWAVAKLWGVGQGRTSTW